MRILQGSSVLLLVPIGVGIVLGASRTALDADPPPPVVANDNRTPAGMLRDGELHLALVVQMARWYPEAEDGPFVEAPVFAEEGGPPQVPGPLIRVPEGTTIVATIRNALADSTLYVHGLAARPLENPDSVAIAPGETRTVRFPAGEAGTYLYRATAGTVDWDVREREQLAGALVVDAPGARTDDRIFVMNVWGEPKDSVSYRNAVTINGKGWPYTERIEATVGDSVRWRVINATVREHPMHLHGFYFRIDAHGSFERDSLYAPEGRRIAVTEVLEPGETMAIVWSPDRHGNWVFHCHLAFHVVDEARLDHGPVDHHASASNPARHMAGLVLGMRVQPDPAIAEAGRGEPRRMRLLVNEGRPRWNAPRALGYVLQRGAEEPAADSVELPGTVLVLTRGEPTDITVVNRLTEPTAVHWHGIELESWSDGIPGWSGAGAVVAPAIAPADSFVAHLTLPRAGTFIYHTHLNDIEQLTSGLYGALIVLEPGEVMDPARDQVFVVGWDHAVPGELPHLLVNGDSVGTPITMRTGETLRLRFINIGPAGPLIFEARRDTVLATWRARARDGADLPPHDRLEGPARHVVNVGMTADYEFTPAEPGVYVLTAALPRLPVAYRRRIIVE